ncbi:MAG: ABC transporter ATP-binding protein/permease [Pseudodesulfovibrio sp.]|uniref:ABC transporter related protein n=1 Tax=Pseudodesulfovibrio aespoeensis (strain ATCC 700646 / DSM 10631 / Aspo-2) TaxID=643562 RepID=E6VYC8_PSEA9|nr:MULTISPECIES: ABC transporter ATP-binding protein [Pseudodesulfovibrio]MBU4244326.1 ABC transporter ATP-binding protein/permease [Pseudomonadota bacterium]ADU61586.1 ABC transporter related protein [Pseudodesulfovibrio aespoeensis Aspo-2]MBU4379468.1 ABC transporter ATP-binding protein/permease [Pseudomonadota bacterium]MBU4474454.1 ABC transporter ATP-binding protein/permease [Pseudomonadota bacterium]MBU4516095.1 ABC transporter ATP-binding protein/permease [Pseudomonadota bacterium]
MTIRTDAVPPLAETWKRMQLASGDQVGALRTCMLFSILSAVAQGLGFACFYPLLGNLLATPSDWDTVCLWAGALAVCAVLDTAFVWMSRRFDYTGCIAEVTHQLRIRLGEQLRRMPLENLYDRRTGELSAVLTGNVDEVVTPMGILSSAFLTILITPAVSVAATALVDWRLALAMAAVFPLALPLYYWRRRSSGRSMRTLAAAHARTNSEMIEYVQGLPVLRATNQVGGRFERLRAALAHLQEVQKEAQLRAVWPGVLFSSLVQIGIIVALSLGVWFILAGTLDVAVLVALLIVVVRFSEPLALIYGLSPVFDYMEAGFEQLEKLFSVRPLPVPESAKTPQRFDVAFEGVRFRYADTDVDVLQEVSFRLPERSLTALVGPSGSGKTTITKLIMRYADPQAGHVRIGGVDVRDMEPRALMGCVSVVFQDVYLFDDTIHANILMGRPGATDAEVETAARAAHCHEFITRLPDGYRTRVGDIGGCLSGGERQRISIARAILKDAPIVMLDEPTAALDTESEVAVQQAIDTLVRDKTVVVIAHRLSTIVGADTILVIDDGKLVQQGGHAELLAQAGRYRSMWEAQQGVKDWHFVKAAKAR